MKTIVRLDVSDEQRNALSCLLAGKEVKRLATREEVGAYVQGAIDRLAPPARPARTLPELGSPIARNVPTEDRARAAFEVRLAGGTATEHEWSSYLRGWSSVGEVRA